MLDVLEGVLIKIGTTLVIVVPIFIAEIRTIPVILGLGDCLLNLTHSLSEAEELRRLLLVP
jgi:hypothetical protein